MAVLEIAECRTGAADHIPFDTNWFDDDNCCIADGVTIS